MFNNLDPNPKKVSENNVTDTEEDYDVIVSQKKYKHDIEEDGEYDDD